MRPCRGFLPDSACSFGSAVSSPPGSTSTTPTRPDGRRGGPREGGHGLVHPEDAALVLRGRGPGLCREWQPSSVTAAQRVGQGLLDNFGAEHQVP
jgi:hypothetical protein